MNKVNILLKDSIIKNFSNFNGYWVKNRDNYDKELGDILGWVSQQESRYDLITPEGYKVEVKKCKSDNPIFKYKQLAESLLEKGKYNIKIMILKTNKEQTKVIEVRLYDEYQLARLILKDENTARDIIRLSEKLGGVYQCSNSFKMILSAELWRYFGNRV